MNEFRIINKEHSENSEGNKSEDPLTHLVISCALEVHKALGPGLLESAYEQCLMHEFVQRGMKFSNQVPMPVEYKGKQLDCAFRADIMIENALIIELKAVDKLQRIHEAQVLTYMKLANIPVGLLINFNSTLLKDGIRRLFLSQSS